MRQTLFRTEALENSRTQYQGQILLARAPKARTLVWISVIVIAVVTFALVLLGFSERVLIPGVIEVEGGTYKLYAPRTGTVTNVFVGEGVAVKTGQPLFVVSADTSNIRSKSAMVEIREFLIDRRASLVQEGAIKRTLFSSQNRQLQDRLARLYSEREGVRSVSEVQRAKIQILEERLNTYQTLNATQFFSTQAVRQVEETLLTQKIQLEEYLRSLERIKTDISQIQTEIADLPAKAQIEDAALARQRSEIDQEILENYKANEGVVTAPFDGFLAGLSITRGQSVDNTNLLATLIPHAAQMEANLFAPNRAIGQIKVGARVNLRYESFPFSQFGQYPGTVIEVSGTPVKRTQIPLGDGGVSVYQLRVRLDHQVAKRKNETFKLRPGMQVVALFDLEYRSLFDWVIFNIKDVFV